LLWTPWRADGYWQTIALAGGPATSLRESEGKHGLVVLRRRYSGRGLVLVVPTITGVLTGTFPGRR